MRSQQRRTSSRCPLHGKRCAPELFREMTVCTYIYIYVYVDYMHNTLNPLDQLQNSFMIHAYESMPVYFLYMHNRINYDQFRGLLYTSWKCMNISEEVPEIWKTLSNHMLCCLRCTLIIKLFCKKTPSLHSSLHGLSTELLNFEVAPFHPFTCGN